MPAGDIVLNMIGNNQLAGAINANVSALGGMDKALDRHITRLQGQAAVTRSMRALMAETHAEQSRGMMLTGRQQMAIQQLTFAVDDAATVYGTSGLAGAVRAAGNNLTVAAAAFGPWGLGIAVAASAVTQLTLAFMKNEKQVKANETAMKGFRGEIEELERAMGRIKPRSFMPGSLSGDEFAGRSNDLKEQARVAGQRRELAQDRLKSLEARIEEFVRTNAADRNNPLGSMTPEARKTYDEMIAETARLSGRITDLLDEERMIAGDRQRLQRELPGIQEREAEQQFQAMQEGEIRRERQRIKEQEDERKRTIDLDRDLRKDLDTEGSKEFERQEIFDEMRRREEQLRGMQGLDATTRGILTADIETAAARKLGALDFKERDSRGPEAFRAGDAETMRFLARARLGAAAQTPEEKKLAKIEENGRKQLEELKKFNSDKPEAEVVDF